VTTINKSGLQVMLTADLAKATGLANLASSVSIQRGVALAAGVGAGLVDRIYGPQTRTLTASSSEDLDLAGSLLDVFGDTAVMARIRAILISAAPGNTNNVLVGGVANGLSTFLSPAASGLITLRPGAVFAMACGSADATGYVVTATTADLLHIANSGAGTSVSYDIAVLGAST
jgi:hypothetical protein